MLIINKRACVSDTHTYHHDSNKGILEVPHERK